MKHRMLAAPVGTITAPEPDGADRAGGGTAFAMLLTLSFCHLLNDMGPCCIDQWERRNHPYPVPRSGDADGLRASQLQHAVEDVDGNLHLGRPTLIRARAQPVADHLLDAT